MDEYYSYINNLDLKDYNNAIVDTISASFTSKKLISKALNKDIYLILFKALSSLKNGNCYLNENTDHIYWCNLVEFIFMAPFLPTYSIKNNEPLYITNVNQYELIKIHIYKKYMIGALLQSIDVIKNLKILNISIKKVFTMKYIDTLIKNMPSKYYNSLKNIKNGYDIYHTHYVDLF